MRSSCRKTSDGAEGEEERIDWRKRTSFRRRPTELVPEEEEPKKREIPQREKVGWRSES